MACAVRHGQQYLAEAELHTMLAANFPPEVHETVVRIAPDVIRQEQFMDFLRNRTFRQTQLTRAEQPVNRSLTTDGVKPLWVASPLRSVNASPCLAAGQPKAFRHATGGELRTPNAVTKAALAFTELLRQARCCWTGRASPARRMGCAARRSWPPISCRAIPPACWSCMPSLPGSYCGPAQPRGESPGTLAGDAGADPGHHPQARDHRHRRQPGAAAAATRRQA